jgi:hypothetical protein
MAERTANSVARPSAPSAFNFVLTFGIVNLFAEMTNEGGAASTPIPR